MNTRLATLTLGLIMAAPIVATAAADRMAGSLPPAADQLLAQDMIQPAQMHLQLAGFHPGRTAGVFDARTAEAVRQYQVAAGLPASGLLDEPTRPALFPGLQNASEDEDMCHASPVWRAARAGVPRRGARVGEEPGRDT